MGFWNKLGKIALQAAPYVAAPFTGGASLMATGATQKLGQMWAEKDAKKAIAKGLAPSKFDKYLGLASAGAGLASSFGPIAGALSGAGKAASTASKVSGWQSKLGTAAKIGNAAISAGGLVGGALQVAREGSDTGPRSEELPTNASKGLGPSAAPRNQYDVGAALNRGRNTALQNQPFRAGYQVHTQGPEEGQVITTTNPPIYPNLQPQVVSPPIDESAPATPIANRFGDELTPARARRRTPIQNKIEQEEY